MSEARIPQLLAFLLPQFHPIPENDEWWGRGFTEWTNVAKARPRFPGHYQPHLPADLGYYDLRLPETRAAQADLARSAGISAFVWYHYWFSGRRVLERPFDEVLASGEPDLPFVLCWANENWTRVWDGSTNAILLQQNYSPQDDVAHMRSLLPALVDSRYFRLNGKPVFLVYHAGLLPEPLRTTERWREVAATEGLDLHLCRVDRFPDDIAVDPARQGFDAAVEFQPDGERLPRQTLLGQAMETASRASRGRMTVPARIYDYESMASNMPATNPPWLRYRGVSPGWDNSARRPKGAIVLHDSTPAKYGAWLERTLTEAVSDTKQAPLVFINAWNEWAEGAHLEPDARWGRDYLTATRQALERHL